jgi:hypothetical protein
VISLILNVLAISPELLWRDYRFIGCFRDAFWFHAFRNASADLRLYETLNISGIDKRGEIYADTICSLSGSEFHRSSTAQASGVSFGCRSEGEKADDGSYRIQIPGWYRAMR